MQSNLIGKQILLGCVGIAMLAAMVALTIVYRYDLLLVPYDSPAMAGVYVLMTPLAITMLAQSLRPDSVMNDRARAIASAIIYAGCTVAGIVCFYLSFVTWWSAIWFLWFTNDPIVFYAFLVLLAGGIATLALLSGENIAAAKGRTLLRFKKYADARAGPAASSLLGKTSAGALLVMVIVFGAFAGVAYLTKPITCNKGSGHFSDAAYALPSGPHANPKLDTLVNKTILTALEKALWKMTTLQRAGGFPIGCYVGGALDGVQYSDRGDGCPLFNDEFSLQSGTPMVGSAYLEMYKVEDDSIYLNVAKKVADALVAVQDSENGGFFYDGRRHCENGSGYQPHPRNPNRANVIDDNIMQGCMSFLLDFYNFTSNKSIYSPAVAQVYLNAINKGLKCLVDTEKVGGGWPQCSNYPSYMYQSRVTLNDGALEDTVDLLIQACALFPSRTDLRPMIERAGQFLIRVQGNGGSSTQKAWAQQYNEATGMPCWGRNFEPPSFASTDGTESAIRIMTAIYVFTSNASYLAPIPAAIEWLNASRINYTDNGIQKQGWSRLYELQTNTPIFGLADGGPYRSPEYSYTPKREGYSWYVDIDLDEIAQDYHFAMTHNVSQYLVHTAKNYTKTGTLSDATNAFNDLEPSGFWLEDGDHVRDKVFTSNALDMIQYLKTYTA